MFIALLAEHIATSYICAPKKTICHGVGPFHNLLLKAKRSVYSAREGVRGVQIDDVTLNRRRVNRA